MELQTVGIPEWIAEAGIETSHHFVGRGYTKVFEIRRGSTLGQHSHDRDHTSMLLLGRVVIETPQVRGEVSAPWVGTIPAGETHAICAIEDSLWACVWPDGEGSA